SFPPRFRSGFLYIHPARTSLAAEEVGGAGVDHRTAEAKSFGLRDQRSAEGTELSSQSDGGPRSPQGGRLRAASSAVGCRTSRSTPPHGRADCRCPESVSG